MPVQAPRGCRNDFAGDWNLAGWPDVICRSRPRGTRDLSGSPAQCSGPHRLRSGAVPGEVDGITQRSHPKAGPLTLAIIPGRDRLSARPGLPFSSPWPLRAGYVRDLFVQVGSELHHVHARRKP